MFQLFAILITSITSPIARATDYDPTVLFPGGHATRAPGVIGENGRDLIDYIPIIANTALSLVSAIAVVMIIVTGVRYIVHMGNDEQLQKAQGYFLWSVVGFICVVLSWTIINVLVRVLQ